MSLNVAECQVKIESRAAAALLLEETYRNKSPTVDGSLPLLLAWSYLEIGRENDAAPLLEWNPIPPPNGMNVFACLYFPRVFYLRALAAEHQKKPDDARRNDRLFVELSGPDPLVWGEERKAQEAANTGK